MIGEAYLRPSRAKRLNIWSQQMLYRWSSPYKPSLSVGAGYATLPCVNRLTRQEQLVLCIIMGLLLTGWAVKAYRAAHPPTQAIQSVKS